MATGWLGEVIHDASARVVAFDWHHDPQLAKQPEGVLRDAIKLLDDRRDELQEELTRRQGG